MSLNEIITFNSSGPDIAVISTLKHDDINPRSIEQKKHQLNESSHELKLSKLDKETTQFFLAGVTPLLFLSLPWFIFAMSYVICLPLFGEYCTDFTWIVPYFKLMIAAYVMYQAMAVVKSKEYFPLPEKLNNALNQDQLYFTDKI